MTDVSLRDILSYMYLFQQAVGTRYLLRITSPSESILGLVRAPSEYVPSSDTDKAIAYTYASRLEARGLNSEARLLAPRPSGMRLLTSGIPTRVGGRATWCSHARTYSSGTHAQSLKQLKRSYAASRAQRRPRETRASGFRTQSSTFRTHAIRIRGMPLSFDQPPDTWRVLVHIYTYLAGHLRSACARGCNEVRCLIALGADAVLLGTRGMYPWIGIGSTVGPWTRRPDGRQGLAGPGL
ncbi:hypothetical protein C8Q80DRAFT_279546 [Daedaleopsis nitida]|nr:hypothetical protein C8Q80DRAFT_279546 [Daedaleopsis nitida]